MRELLRDPHWVIAIALILWAIISAIITMIAYWLYESEEEQKR